MKGPVFLLLLPGILWGTNGAGGAAVSGEHADSKPSSGKDISEYSTESRAPPGATPSAPLPALQAHLNAICEQKLEERCKSVDDDLCRTRPVARKGVGALPEQSEMAWRCYGNLSVEENKRDVFCVDSCGMTFKCLGTVPAKSLHMTLPELETAVSDTVVKFCNPFQRLLNDYCNNLKDGWVARMGVLSEKEENKKWRCYDVGMLEYERSSRCLDNCGDVSPCRGGRPLVPEVEGIKHNTRGSLESTVNNYLLFLIHLFLTHIPSKYLPEGSDFLTIEDAHQQLSTVELPCAQDQVCMRTLENPAKCVLPHEAEAAREEAADKEEEYAAAAAAAEQEEDEEEGGKVSTVEGEILESGPAGKRSSKSHDLHPTGPSQDLRLGSTLLYAGEETVTRKSTSPSNLSALLSFYCMREFEYLCEEEKLDEFCLGDWESVVARRDLGTQHGAESPAWRCVEKQKLDKSLSSVCVDACGQKYICPGGIDIQNTVHAMWPQLEMVVGEKADEMCAKATGGGVGESAGFTG